MYPRDTHGCHMPIKLKTTLTLVGHSLRCVIPKPVCEELHLEEGDQLSVDLRGGRIILERLKPKIAV
ncbi:AbrB/MazE/SpoVT family DNA-binding domain-containing protein [Candidatus Bathyarchaeota archaeon]|nr:MAG: AbrB/MazE/SpoVT family DNA-binding domain-containing protein [Candidatus Bathyarchaeota archaeon]